MPDPDTSWPPPIHDQPSDPVPQSDPAEDALHAGWRLLLLGACCAPPVFLPLAVWQAVAASRFRAGAGTSLLLSAIGVVVGWSAVLLFFVLR